MSSRTLRIMELSKEKCEEDLSNKKQSQEIDFFENGISDVPETYTNDSLCFLSTNEKENISPNASQKDTTSPDGTKATTSAIDPDRSKAATSAIEPDESKSTTSAIDPDGSKAFISAINSDGINGVGNCNEDFECASIEVFSEMLTIEPEYNEPDINSDDSVPDRNYVTESSSSSSGSSGFSSSSSSTSSESESENEGTTEDACQNVNKKEANTHEPDQVKKSRKRKAIPETWKKNFAKTMRNSGKRYVSCSKSKKIIEERQVLPSCNEKCKLKCYTKFTEQERKCIFDGYWGLADLQRQRDFISANMTTVTPKYRYVRENSHRKPNNAFYFEIGEKRIHVCKLFFKATLSINDRHIRTVLNKRSTEVGQILRTDFRGKHSQHVRLSEDTKAAVRRHIESIPRIPSYYCRAHTSKEYIEGGKTIAELHRDYQALCHQNNVSSVNHVMYAKILNEEYNIAFFSPKKDQCEFCASYQNSNENEKENLKLQYEDHQQQKDLSRLEKQKDKESDSLVFVYDLQAVLPCPKGDTSSFYYVSNLNSFNFTIYDIKNNDVTCYVWHEAEASRGSNEIGSCVLDFLEELNGNLNKGFDIIFYSDNCTGQQKNKFLISMYLHAVRNLEKINSISHKFLITGHTQNEGDNAHSLIERNIKRSLKSGPIYVPEQYVTLIRSAKKLDAPIRSKKCATKTSLT